MSSPSIRALLIFGGLLAPAAPAAAQCPDGAPPPCGPARVVRPRVQVLNFTASDSADAYLASGLAEDVRAALIESRAVILIGPRARAGAELVLTADVHRTGQGVVVAARIERVPAGTVVWSQRLSRVSRDLPGIPAELASRALAAAGIRDAARISARREDPVIYDLYMRGQYHASRRTQASLSRAVGLYREAIARDAASPLGWVGLARSMERANRWHFQVDGVPPESILAIQFAAAERAVELAPNNPEVLIMRGQVAQDIDPTSRAASLRAFRAAIAIDSSSADAWRGLAFAYLDQGDDPNGRAALRLAARFAPEDADVLTFGAIIWFLTGDLDSAAAWAERAVAADPTSINAHAIAGQAALWRGRLDEAEAKFAAADRLTQGASDRVGQYEQARIYAARGDSARARAFVVAAAAATDTLSLSSHAAIALGDGYLAVGDTTRAFWWLERYRPRRDLHFQLHLRGEPAFAGLRNDPRFRALQGLRP